MHDEPAHDVILRESDGVFICRRCGLFNPGDEETCVSSAISMRAIDETEYEKAA